MKGYKIVNFGGEPFVNCIFLEETTANKIIDDLVSTRVVQRFFLKVQIVDILVKNNNIVEDTTISEAYVMKVATGKFCKLPQIKILRDSLNIGLADASNIVESVSNKNYLFSKQEIEEIRHNVNWNKFITESLRNGYIIEKL